jgi:putative hydrolase of the HAD superfamily
MSPASIGALCFDFDGTLAHFAGDWRDWVDRLRVGLGLPETVRERFAKRLGAALTADPQMGVSLTGAVATTLDDLPPATRPRPAGVAGTIEHALTTYAAAVEPLPGAHTLLAALHGRGVPLAVVTNGPEDMQRAALAQSGLGGFVRAALISGDPAVGARKPGERIFALACAAMATDPAHTLMVGDRLGTDIRGALAAGMQGAWLDRSAPPERVLVAEDHYIAHDLEALTPWLLRHLAGGALE